MSRRTFWVALLLILGVFGAGALGVVWRDRQVAGDLSIVRDDCGGGACVTEDRGVELPGAGGGRVAEPIIGAIDSTFKELDATQTPHPVPPSDGGGVRVILIDSYWCDGAYDPARGSNFAPCPRASQRPEEVQSPGGNSEGPGGGDGSDGNAASSPGPGPGPGGESPDGESPGPGPGGDCR